MTKKLDFKVTFLQLRAQNISIRECAERLKCSPSTLIKLSRELKGELWNAKTLELEHIQKELLKSRLKTVSSFGAQLQKIRDEINKRLENTDLNELSLRELIELQGKTLDQLNKCALVIPENLEAFDLESSFSVYSPSLVTEFESINL